MAIDGWLYLQSMYPLTSRLGGVVLDAPGARDHYLTEPPSIELRNRVSHDSYSTLHFTLKTREPCWGVLNITGHVLRWSFTDGLPATAVSEVRDLMCGFDAVTMQLAPGWSHDKRAYHGRMVEWSTSSALLAIQAASPGRSLSM